MRARIGDLVIIKFDGNLVERDYNEKVGLVTGCFTTLDGREYEFIYWNKIGNHIEVIKSSLPQSRLIRAKPKKKWNGELSSLTINDVIPV